MSPPLIFAAGLCNEDGQLNPVELMYGVMNDVFVFAERFKEFPPRSTPSSFNPANILEDTMRTIQGERKLKEAFPMLREGVETNK